MWCALSLIAFAGPPAFPTPELPMHLPVARLWDGRPARPDEVVDIRIIGTDDALIVQVSAPFHDDPPPDASPGALWGLWRHEVVEVFIVGVGDPVPYTEIELGPHGHHLVIQLAGVREVVARELPVDFQARIEGDRWTGEARIPRSLLPAAPVAANAFAIHGTGADRRYLAWHALPGDRPDFHRIDDYPDVSVP